MGGNGRGRDGWREGRREAAAEHAAAWQRRRAAETARARRLVAEFVDRASATGLTPEPLLARPYRGRGTYRTGLLGWYLRRDRSVGIGTDGNFYVLSVPGSLRARLRGVTLEPQDPPLVVGAGGRDGESIDLDTLLRQRLADRDDAQE